MKPLKSIIAVAAFFPAVAFANDFSGFHASAFLGAAKASDEATGYWQGTSDRSGFTHSTNPTGGLLGFAVGYNHALTDRLLVGAEVDLEARGSQRDRSFQKYKGVTETDYSVRSQLRAAASLRARLGYLVTDRTLVYVTAGYAAAHVKRTFIDEEMPPIERESRTRWQDGWTAGIGGQYLVRQNLSAGIEYRYSDFGTDKVRSRLWLEDYKQKLRDQSVRVSLTYHY
ncbi:outer membrane protein [Azoarcus taiwanensis]|uniref:Outer membrane beta-barrel protein n=1 Tax=Azoarcus taiwanensis TaxID=666964 RepID=A0A972FE84_9RHOO|nr:outer membrane beta-barrel protein [Azoarcus taiwanensis]NMG03873.1 outer membrane beta-barrel protein [Azoarcus taiwanensis]